MKWPASCCDKDILISQLAPDKVCIEPPILIRKNSQMNCYIGDESKEFVDWSVNLPASSSEERLTNKNWTPHWEKVPNTQGGRTAWGTRDAQGQETFLERTAKQLNTQERPPIYPKALCSWEKGCLMWRPHITEVRRSSRTDLWRLLAARKDVWQTVKETRGRALKSSWP